MHQALDSEPGTQSRVSPHLIALLGILFLLPLAIFLTERLRQPGDGAQVVLDLSRISVQGFVVNPLTPGSPGLRTGDIVVAVQGRSVDDWLRDAFAGKWGQAQSDVRQTLDYSLLRDGQTRTIVVDLKSYPLLPALIDDWGLYFFFVTQAVIGLLVFARRPQLASAQLFFLFSTANLVSNLIFVMSYQVSDLLLGWMFPLMLATDVILYLYEVSAILHFTLIFPRRHPLLARHPALRPGVYLGIWLVYAAFMLQRWPSAPTFAAGLQLHTQGIIVAGATYFPLILMVALNSYRTSLTATERRQMRWFLWGATVALVPWLGIFALSSFYGVPYRSTFPLMGVFLTAFPVVIAIAILRERLFDIDLIINRTLVYGPLTAILAGLFAAAITLSQKLFEVLTGQKSDAAIVLTTLLVVAAFTPIRDALQKLVDRRFKEAPESTKRLQAFAEQVQSRVTTIEPNQVTRRLLEEAALAFGAKNGAAYLESAGELRLIGSVGEWNGKAKLSVPLETAEHGKRLGVLMLGERGNGFDYTPSDRGALEEIASLVALAIEQDSKSEL